MNKLKIAYFGTPSFSAQLLEMILNDKDLPVEVALVVTQPDKPVGRKQVLTPSPVKEVVKKYRIKMFPEQMEQQNFRRSQLSKTTQHDRVDLLRKFSLGHLLKNLRIDLALLFAYGKIIPKDLLSIPRFGFWNIHPSLLPKYRGASPIAYPILLGDMETGVTLIQMDDQLDHGPIIAQEKMKILADERRIDLEDKLTRLAFHVFKASINALTCEPVNQPVLKKQDHSLATFTRQLKKSDGFIPFETLKRTLAGQFPTPEEFPQILREYCRRNSKFFNVYNLFRSLSPWPGIWTTVMINGSQKRLKITDMEMKKHVLSIKKVQLEGKNEVDFETFNRAYHVFQLNFKL